MNWKEYKKDLWNGYKPKIIWFSFFSLIIASSGRKDLIMENVSRGQFVIGLIIFFVGTFLFLSTIYLFCESTTLIIKQSRGIKSNGN